MQPERLLLSTRQLHMSFRAGHYDPHFTDEKTEAHAMKALPLISPVPSPFSAACTLLQPLHSAHCITIICPLLEILMELVWDGARLCCFILKAPQVILMCSQC